MGHLSHLSLLLLLVAISRVAALTGRDYWNHILPKTPMPNAIGELLDSGKQNPGKQDPEHTLGIINKAPYPLWPQVEFASEGHLDKIDPNVAIVFLEEDLHSGKKMILEFTQTSPNSPHFIPRSEANKFPFSSTEFSQILDHFKIEKDSSEADLMKQTLNDCEKPAVNGEKKYCATSLESMVDFATSSLKTRYVHPLSTNVNSPNAPKQEYRIVQSKIMAGNELVICHGEPYAYAVFYCHMNKSTRAYMVKLVGKKGVQVTAIAVCHGDTSSWNPKHFAFQLLKVQPGTVPICHFLTTDAVAWTRAA